MNILFIFDCLIIETVSSIIVVNFEVSNYIPSAFH